MVKKEHYHQISNNYMINAAARFFKNILRNYDGNVATNDFFAPITLFFAPDRIVDCLRDALPLPIAQAMINSPRRATRLVFEEDTPSDLLLTAWANPEARPHVVRMLSRFATTLCRRTSHIPPAAIIPRRFAELQQVLSLSDLDRDIVLFALCLRNHQLAYPTTSYERSTACRVRYFAMALDLPLATVKAALSSESRLRRYNCLDSDFDFNEDLCAFITGLDSNPLSSRYYRRDTAAPLAWDSFGGLAVGDGALIERMIRAGAPANILLYGAPGTGKTSFARALAARLGRTCYFVAQCRESESDRRDACATSDRSFRFGALQIAAGQVDPSKSLLVVDEADRMLASFTRGDSGDKGLLNSVLDATAVPTVWIANTAAGDLDPSSRRRFDFSVRFAPLDLEARLRVWRTAVRVHGLVDLLPDAQLVEFARAYLVSAGGIDLALRNVAKIAPAPAEVHDLVVGLLKPHCSLLGVTRAAASAPAADYSLEGLNVQGPVSPEDLVSAARRFLAGEHGPDVPRLNILLTGAPGTGKTEFVKYLGCVLGRPVVTRMGSDLLGRYVGESEKNIAAAFAAARDEGSILFLDEIDGLLQSRASADHAWEVSQVNELLHQIENFDGLFVGATNFSSRLDAAVLRRFTFKLEFGYLSAAGKERFFERFFPAPLAPAERAELAAIPDLAPGDFRTVRQSLFYRTEPVTNATRLAALRRESDIKRGGGLGKNSASIGFGAVA